MTAVSSLAALERLCAAANQGGTSRDLRLPFVATSREWNPVYVDSDSWEADRALVRACDPVTVALLARLAIAAVELADEAARSVTEPRRFHENEDGRQQVLAGKLTAVRLLAEPFVAAGSSAAEDVGASPCGDSRCGHPQGWHRHGAGACLECACTGFVSAAAEEPRA